MVCYGWKADFPLSATGRTRLREIFQYYAARLVSRALPVTVFHQFGEARFQFLQLGHLHPHGLQIAACEIAGLNAGAVGALKEIYEVPHTGNGKAQFTAPPDEGDAPQIGLVVGPMAAVATVSGTEQPDLLVVADRRRVGPARACKRADGKVHGATLLGLKLK